MMRCPRCLWLVRQRDWEISDMEHICEICNVVPLRDFVATDSPNPRYVHIPIGDMVAFQGDSITLDRELGVAGVGYAEQIEAPRVWGPIESLSDPVLHDFSWACQKLGVQILEHPN